MGTGMHTARLLLLTPLVLNFLVYTQTVVTGQSFMDYTISRLSEVCPYSAFCNQGPARQLQDERKSPCCTPCSCDEDCFTVGNCCPDASPSKKSTTPIAECRFPLLASDITLINAKFKDFRTYYIIGTCPPEYPDKETLLKCTNPQFNRLQDSSDVAIVSTSNKIYSNHYCAKCNNATRFTRWTTTLHNFDFGTIYSTDRIHIPSAYVLEFIPVNGNVPMHSQCFIDVISKCNITGNQEFVDYNLTKACEENTFHYIHERNKWASNTYTNPFCFICNNKQGTTLPTKCTARDDGTGAQKAIGDTSFSTVLKTGEWDTARHRLTNSRAGACRTDEIYDTYFDVCRQLHCPVFSEPVDGHCVSPYLVVNGFVVSVVFEITTDKAVDWDEIRRVDSSAFQRINNKLEKALALADASCIQCMNKFRYPKATNTLNQNVIYHLVSQKVTYSCPIQTVLDTYRKVFTRHIQFTLKFQGDPVVFQVRLSKTSPSLVTMFEWDYIIANSMASECIVQYVLLDQFCEYVEISIQDYNTLNNRSYPLIIPEEFRLVKNEEDNGLFIYRVCKEDYFLNENRNSASIPSKMFHMFLISIFLYWI